MKKGRIFVSLLMSLVIVGSSLTGCTYKGGTPAATGTADAGSGGKQVLRFVYSVDIPNFDPQLANSMVNQTVGTTIIEGLVRLREGKIMPGAAEKWDVSEDGKTYTFHLRDSKWSDGQPVTANDFEYAIKRLCDPKTAAPYAYASFYIQNAEEINSGKIKDLNQLGVKALDDKTLEIKLKAPGKYILSVLAGTNFAPVRKDIIEKYGKDFAAAPDKMVYNGAFTMTNWTRQKEVDLAKNPNYWDAGNVKLDEVNILQVDNGQTMVNMYESGDTDMLDLVSAAYDKYKKDSKQNVLYYDTGSVEYMLFNAKSSNPLVTNINFRKAIACGFDRAEYVKLSSKDLNLPAERLILPDISGVNDKFNKEHPLHYYPAKADVTKAKDYLAKAMQELNISDPSKVSFKLLINDAYKTYGEAIQAILKQNLGITVKLDIAPYADQIDRCLKLNYDVACQGWNPDYDDPMTYLDLWVTGGTQNMAGTSNPEYDKLIQEAKSTADQKTRGDLMAQAEKMLLDDSYVMPYDIGRGAYVVKPGVKDMYRYFVGANPDFVYTSVNGK